MSYCAYITRIKNLRKHSNADRLQVGECFGNSIIVDLNTKEGDLGVYFPTDGRLGIEYCEENNLLRKKDENGNNIGGYLEPEKRHIKTIKLRGEPSDGLFMPLKSLEKFCDITKLKEGDTITVLNGILICEKYIPRSSRRTNKQNINIKKKKDVEVFPYFEEHVDTTQLAYNLNQFKEGDLCYITLKLHGTSQRTSHAIKEQKRKLPKWIYNILHIPSVKRTWDYVTGTRRVILENFHGGFYGDNEFRKLWHDYFLGKLHKGESIYYEVVGYVKDDQTIMPSCNNKKTNDKEFIKKYGNITRFTYGCGIAQNDIYVYRMTMTNDDGYIVEYPWELVKLRCEQMGVKHVPELDKFIYTTEEDLMERVNKFVDGEDPIGKTHIREGIVIRIDNKEKFKAFKHKNFWFKCLEGIIKADDVLDMEEADSQ